MYLYVCQRIYILTRVTALEENALQRALINQNIFVFGPTVPGCCCCWKGSLPMRRQGWTRAFLRNGERARGRVGYGNGGVRCRYDCYCCCCCCYGWRCLVDFGRQSPSVLPSSPSRLPPVLLEPAARQPGSLADRPAGRPAANIRQRHSQRQRRLCSQIERYE